MAKIEKLIDRLLSRPADFTWEELIKILGHFGYSELKSGGSRRKFADNSNNIIALHKPHPQNILKRYMLDLVIDHLKDRGKIKND